MWNLEKDTDELISSTETDPQTQKTNSRLPKGRVGQTGWGADEDFGIDVYTLLLLLLSHISRVRLCATPQTAAHQAPPSLGFSRQAHRSGLPFPSPANESEK